MLHLKPLIIITGTLHVEGGLKSQRRASSAGTKQRNGTRTTIVQDRDVSEERQRAHVIFSTYSRQIKALRLIKTPFGVLVHPNRLRDVQALLVGMTKTAAVFNQSTKLCKIENCLVWEELVGNRKAALEGWLARRRFDGDAGIIKALPDLQAA
jgi:hypothetical protein